MNDVTTFQVLNVHATASAAPTHGIVSNSSFEYATRILRMLMMILGHRGVLAGGHRCGRYRYEQAILRRRRRLSYAKLPLLSASASCSSNSLSDRARTWVPVWSPISTTESGLDYDYLKTPCRVYSRCDSYYWFLSSKEERVSLTSLFVFAWVAFHEVCHGTLSGIAGVGAGRRCVGQLRGS